VYAVGGRVDDVVDGVDRAGQKAEDEERAAAADEQVPVEELFGEDQRRQDEDVLHPLMRPHRAHDAAREPQRPWRRARQSYG